MKNKFRNIVTQINTETTVPWHSLSLLAMPIPTVEEFMIVDVITQTRLSSVPCQKTLRHQVSPKSPVFMKRSVSTMIMPSLSLIKLNVNRLRVIDKHKSFLYLVSVIRTKSNGAYNSPHCGGLLSSCKENDANKLECADALCKAQGYSVGTFVNSSNNFCTSHFEYTNYLSPPYHAYSLDGHDVYYGNYSNVAIITADCTPSGEPTLTFSC